MPAGLASAYGGRPLDQILNAILKGLEVVYGRPWLALCALILMFVWAGVIIVQARRRTAPFLRSAADRVAALKSALGDASDAAIARKAFSENFLDVMGALEKTQPGSESLVVAWREFHESIIDENASPIRNAVRPSSYFNGAAPRFTGLIFASNAFVATGLILTFIGLVVALHTAAGNMGDVDKAKNALTLLLTIASAKFLTSIGGIGASLWLRFAEHGLSRRVGRDVQAICGLLERGMLYVSPQQLAAEQLEVLKEQRDQLKFFNTDVALQLSERIGVQFQQAIAPVTASLAQLNDNMTSMSEGLGQGAAKAVAEASGGELRALGQTLATLGERLDMLSATVGASGDDAARQIKAAGADFAAAATDIRAAFDKLAAQVDGIGGKLAEQGEIAAQAHDAALQRVLDGLERTQARSADVMTDAVKALQDAGAKAAETMQREVSEALASGVAESQRTFRTALDESGEALRGTASGLAGAIGDAATKIERAGADFTRSGENASLAAQAMGMVTSDAQAVARAIGDAATGFGSAAAPVTQASQSMGEAASRMARTTEVATEANVAVLTQLRELAEGIRETQTAAEMAWRDYRGRFEGVDKALAATTVKLGETLGDSFEEFRKFATKFDSEMAGAVSKLGNALTQIEEYAGALDEYVEDSRKVSVGARA